MIDMWRWRPPGTFDFPNLHESFKWFNYQYVLYGMGFRSDVGANAAAYPHTEAAKLEFHRVQAASQRAAAAMPMHRALLDEVYAHGFRTPAPSPADAAVLEGLHR